MSPEQKRKFNTMFGGTFMAIGLVAWSLTAWFAITPNPKKPAPVINSTSIDLASCAQSLRHLGYEVSIKDKDIAAFVSLSPTDPKGQLVQASMASTMCRLPMKTFCMGEGCEKPGLSFVVTAAEEKRAVVAPAKADANASAKTSAKAAKEAKAKAAKDKAAAKPD